MSAPDLEAMTERLLAYALTWRNTAVDPDEPLVNEAFEIGDHDMRDDNDTHQSPRFGVMHDDIDWEDNDLLSGGFNQDGVALWRMVLLIDSPQRLNGFRGPRGARTLIRQAIDYLNNWPIDGDDGQCLLQVKRLIRWKPIDSSLSDECGYYLEAKHPVFT